MRRIAWFRCIGICSRLIAGSCYLDCRSLGLGIWISNLSDHYHPDLNTMRASEFGVYSSIKKNDIWFLFIIIFSQTKMMASRNYRCDVLRVDFTCCIFRFIKHCYRYTFFTTRITRLTWAYCLCFAKFTFESLFCILVKFGKFFSKFFTSCQAWLN